MHVTGRRWFDRRHGNTYHSVTIMGPENSIVASADFAYGYGDQWMQTAHELLVEKGLVPGVERTKAIWQIFKEMEITYDVTDVGRKRDL
ncbi:hypothetical protein LCGC14_2345060 [marine sediment metagenome]|uniref:Uncharacterized protein n=1 Tax=marine sediment metagenome TaxID=412755 RepID=A0A0F9CBN1_9ZZZZ